MLRLSFSVCGRSLREAQLLFCAGLSFRCCCQFFVYLRYHYNGSGDMSEYITGTKVPVGCISWQQVEAASVAGKCLETTIPAPWVVQGKLLVLS